jgi:hypothetical protein
MRRHLIDMLNQYVQKNLPPDFTGRMTFTVHIREAKVVKVIVGVEETLPAADWINWCKQAHANRLPLGALDHANRLEFERRWSRTTDC